MVKDCPFVVLLGLLILMHVSSLCGISNPNEPSARVEGLIRGLTFTETKKRNLGMETSTGGVQNPELTSSAEPAPSLTITPNPITTFCLIADAPYSYEESLVLLDQLDHVDSECEFVAHLGDIRSARLFDTCVQETYTNTSLIMKRSQKPVLMILGDNEWNDCPNHEQALGYWHDEFDNFVNHWPHGFGITSQPGRTENMYFIHKQAMFITLNIVG